MIRNYFKSAFRNLWKSKFYSLLNICGLAVGLATSIMLLLWVQNEWSYDRFHQESENIFRVNAHFKTNDGENVWATTPGPLKVYSRKIPEIKEYVRINYAHNQPMSDVGKNIVLQQNDVAMIDDSFFSIFNFPLLYGDNETALADPNHVIITKETAEKIFGQNQNLQQLIGETILINRDTFQISGIAENIPKNSSIRFDALVPMAYYAALFTSWGGNGDWKTIDTDLGNYSFGGYAKLEQNTDPAIAGTKLTDLFLQDIGEDTNIHFSLQPFTKLHLIGADGNNAAQRQTQIIMMVVLMILAIASINYVNLSTARSSQRAKEVSVRKIIGASKWQLFFQFLSETVVLFGFAILLAVGLIYLLMPLYNSITGTSLSFSLLDLDTLKPAALAILGTLLASSIYPALLLSSFKPIESLKGKITAGVGTTMFRKVLVVSQFAIAVILIAGTILMGNQMDYMKNKNLGYDKSHVFVTAINDNARDHLDAIKSELASNAAIENVAVASMQNMANIQSNTGDLEWPGKPEGSGLVITQLYAEKEFIPTMDINLLEGENFTGTPADSSSFILNQAAVRAMGLKPPYLGQEITFHSRKGKIKGIVEDFNFRSLKEEITPLILFSFWDIRNYLYVRSQPAQSAKAIAAVRTQLSSYAGDTPFSYHFLDEQFDQQYRSDEQSGTLFRVFAGVAIFLSCLGLLGLATFTAQLRKKEIGIRKVLGASVTTIVQLINFEFLKLVILAIIIATPVAWYFMDEWLQDFAYRTDLSWWIFALAGILTLGIALVTVSFQAIKAAIANPVKSLRTE